MKLYLVLLLLLCLSAALGYMLARIRYSSHSSDQQLFSSRYFDGVNFLLNEQPDKAVDVFIEMIEVNSETVETHLALGSLFRRRGEVDRAIRIHQNLIARPSLSRQQRVQALFELGKDYMRAGVLDRAESLFLQLEEMGEHNEQSLEQLIDIYQQQHDWQHAIAAAKKLEHLQNSSQSRLIAHYWCELAEEAKVEGNLEQALKYARQAARLGTASVRPRVLLVELLCQLADYRGAKQQCEYIAKYHPLYLNEVFEYLLLCYEELAQHDKLSHFLQQVLAEASSYPLLNKLADKFNRPELGQAVQGILLQQLEEQPSIYGMRAYVELQCSEQNVHAHEGAWQKLRDFIDKILASKPAFQCENCGLSSNALYWYCPSCKSWETVKPLSIIDSYQAV